MCQEVECQAVEAVALAQTAAAPQKRVRACDGNAAATMKKQTLRGHARVEGGIEARRCGLRLEKTRTD